MRPFPALLYSAVLVLAGSGGRGGGPSALAGDEPTKLETTHLVRIALDPEGVDGESLKVAPRSAHVVWRVQKEGRWAWVLDGKPGKAYADVGPLVFSDDGVHWAHFARTDEKRVLVLDGEEGAVTEPQPLEASLRFLPAGKRLAFLAGRTGEGGAAGQVLVVDATAGPLFDEVEEESIVFSADGKRSAYRGTRGATVVVVVDGKAGEPFSTEGVGKPVFSADGTRWAYDVHHPESRLIVDGVPGPVFESIAPPTFAPTGHRLGGVGVREGKVVVWIEGQPVAPVIDTAAPVPLFSQDGAHVAYAALKEDGWRVVLDGQDGPVFPRLGNESLQFSPDGKRHAYWAGKGPKPFLVIDGVPQNEVDQVGVGQASRFSPDSKRFAYSAQRGGKWVVVTDGVEGPETDGIGDGFPLFTPDSAHVVYQASVGGAWRLFVDGKPGPAFDGFSEGALAFGLDGASVGVVARRGALGRIVVDGVEGEEYQALLPGSALTADGPRSFHAWFLRGQEILHERASRPK